MAPLKSPKDEGNGLFFSVTEVMELEQPGYLIDSLLPQDGIALLYGQPSCGKSFLALDWALAVATESEWGGRTVQQGSVVYAAAESLSGYGKRIESWLSRNGKDLLDIEDHVDFLRDAPSLTDTAAMGRLTTGITERHADLALVVIDTFSRCMVGEDENGTKATTQAIDNLDRLQQETGALILVVHHPRKDGSEARGSSALLGAVECAMLLKKCGNDGMLQLKCEKQKNFEVSNDVFLRLVTDSSSATLDIVEGPKQSKVIKKAKSVHGRSPSVGQILSLLPSHGTLRKPWRESARELGIESRTFNRVVTDLFEKDLLLKDEASGLITRVEQ